MPECSGAPNESKPPRLIFAVDHRFMREGAAGAAVFFRDRRAEQAGLAGLGPHLARIDVLLVPLLDVRREFVGDEALDLLFEQHDVFGHPGGAGEVEGGHGGFHSGEGD